MTLNNEAMQEIEDRWDTATPNERLAWYNGMAKRPGSMGHYVMGILELANQLAAKVTSAK